MNLPDREHTYYLEQLIRNKQGVRGRLIEEGACTLGFPRIREGLRGGPVACYRDREIKVGGTQHRHRRHRACRYNDPWMQANGCQLTREE